MTVVSLGQAITGFVVSCTVMVCRQVMLLPQLSSAFQVRSMVDSSEQLPANRIPIPLPQQVDNLTNEVIVSVGDQLLTFFEANGAVVNPSPAAQVFDRDLTLARAVPFPVMEYRVTDATQLDANGNFWVLNTYTLGTFGLRPADDQIAQQSGQGCTHAYYRWVERLVELHYDAETGVTLSGTPPIQLALQGTLLSRNWEGLVRLDDLGFLVASDKYPNTQLGFIPLP